MSYGLYFDMSRCIGCRTCQVACKDRHDLQTVGPRTRRVASYESGAFPNPSIYHVAVSCNHCEDPACVKSCPTTAMHKTDDGLVVHDDSLCVQCRYCMMVCPYGAPQWDEATSMIVKCDSCMDLREAGKNPVCVDACLTRALDFGDIDELREKYGSGLVSEIPAIGPADLTHPNLLLRVTEGVDDETFNEVAL